MVRKRKPVICVCMLFVLLTFIHLLPLPLHPSRSVSETIDSLLNTWIISHVHSRLFSNPLELFQANIFHPHPNTLTYSEHLLPQALLALPVALILKNPILAYNVVFLLAFFLNGFIMYLFIRYLTKSELAGIACGIMFAFNTYNFNHISHLQMLYAWPIPLSFLFLHKYFGEGRLKDSVFFSLFFAVQALCSIYYGLFFISILAVMLPIFLLVYRKRVNISFLLKLAVPLGVAGSVLLAFSLPYLSLFKTFGFQRGLTKGADLIHYLAVNPHNVILARMLNSLGRHEYFLCPGLGALILAALFLWKKRSLFRISVRPLRWALYALIMVHSLVIGILLGTGGFSLDLGFFRVSAHNLAKPAFILFILSLFVLIAGLLRFIRKRDEKSPNADRHVFLYTVLFSWSLLLSMGSSFNFLGDSTSVVSLPFQWFYEHLPGFKGIRVPSRYAIFVIFSVVVLSGHGIKLMERRIRGRKYAFYAGAGLLLLLNLEYLSLPQRIRYVPVKEDIPPTYLWLKDRPGKQVIVELPFRDPIGRDAIYMYFSIYHRKRMVNGYSGFFPPAIFYIRKMFRAFPSWASMDILKALDVDFVILHRKMYKDEVGSRIIQRIEKDFSGDLKLRKKFHYTFKKPNDVSDKFGEDFVYEVISSQEEKEPEEGAEYQEIHPQLWDVTSNRGAPLLAFLRDNNWTTHWTTGREKTTGDYLLVEFREPERVDKVSLYLGRFLYDYALRMRVETSSDGERWHVYHRLFSPGEFVKNLVYKPLELVQSISLPGERIKFLKIVQVGNDKMFWWSAVELKLYKKVSEN